MHVRPEQLNGGSVPSSGQRSLWSTSVQTAVLRLAKRV